MRPRQPERSSPRHRAALVPAVLDRTVLVRQRLGFEPHGSLRRIGPRRAGGASERDEQVVFATTFGAVFGPMLATPAEHAGERWFGLGPTPGRGCSAQCSSPRRW
ncbi:MAG: hypothetical protein R2705_12045 [Ilumatobacteraceae bacterium]